MKPEPPPEAPPRDLNLETLARVLSGEVLVQVHCYRGDEMRNLVALADEYGFHIRAFHHALEAYKVRDLIAAHGIAVATWSDWWGFKMEAFDGIQENAALVTEAGARATIHSDSAIAIQRLNQDAAKAMEAGRAAGIDVDEDDALRWITANAAWVLGIDDVVGTLEKGKRADVVVWSGSPWSVYSLPEVVIQAGEVVFRRAAGLGESDFELANAAPKTGWKVGTRPALGLTGPAPGAPATPGAAPASASATSAPAPDFAIENATVFVTPDRAVRDATIVVRKGRVSAVGARVAVPAGLRRIDGRGRVVTAGLVDAASSLGLVEVELEPTTADGRFDPTTPIHAAYRAVDGYDPSSVAIAVARAGGVTSAVSAPAGGLVAGASAWVTLADRAGDDAVIKSPLAMVAALGEQAIAATSGSRGMATLRLREVLDDAVQYARRRGNYERNQTRSFAASRLDLEALVPVVRGVQPLVVRAHRATDIRAALRLARELRLRLVIEGGTEAWMVAGELARAKVPVLLNPTQNLPSSFERIHVRDLAQVQVLRSQRAVGPPARPASYRPIVGELALALARPVGVPAPVQAVPLDLSGRVDEHRPGAELGAARRVPRDARLEPRLADRKVGTEPAGVGRLEGRRRAAGAAPRAPRGAGGAERGRACRSGRCGPSRTTVAAGRARFRLPGARSGARAGRREGVTLSRDAALDPRTARRRPRRVRGRGRRQPPAPRGAPAPGLLGRALRAALDPALPARSGAPAADRPGDARGHLGAELLQLPDVGTSSRWTTRRGTPSSPRSRPRWATRRST